MNENTLINNPRKRSEIFHSLMSVELHGASGKTLQQQLKELKELEDQGKLKIYRPEDR